MLPVLVIGVWLNALFQTVGPLMMGLGKPQYAAIADFIKTGALFLGLIFGARYGGFETAIFALPFSELLAYISVQPGLMREKLLFLKQDLASVVLFVSAVFILIGMVFIPG